MSETTIQATIKPIGWRSYRRYYGIRIIVWFKNLWNWRTAWAVNYLSKQIQRDPELRQAWQSSIAMPIYDTICHDRTHLHIIPNGTIHDLTSGQVANQCADRLMKHLFGA